MDLKGLVRRLLKVGQRQLDPSRFGGKRVEVHYCEDGLTVLVGLRESDQVAVVDRMKDEVVVFLESSVLAPNPVNPRDDLAQTVGAANLPLTHLVFVRIPVLFATGL